MMLLLFLYLSTMAGGESLKGNFTCPLTKVNPPSRAYDSSSRFVNPVDELPNWRRGGTNPTLFPPIQRPDETTVTVYEAESYDEAMWRAWNGSLHAFLLRKFHAFKHYTTTVFTPRQYAALWVLALDIVTVVVCIVVIRFLLNYMYRRLYHVKVVGEKVPLDLPQQVTSSSPLEMSVPGSPSWPITKTPRGIAIIHTGTPGSSTINSSFGVFSKMKIGNKIYGVTAFHVYKEVHERVRHVESANCFIRVDDTDIPLDILKAPRKFWSHYDDFDIVGIELSSNFWSNAKMKTLKTRFDPRAGQSVAVNTPLKDGSWETSIGVIKHAKGPFRFVHTASTRPGASGSPITIAGVVVGIHTRSLPEKELNSGTALTMLRPNLVKTLEVSATAMIYYNGRMWTRQELRTLVDLAKDYDNYLFDYSQGSDNLNAGILDRMEQGDWDEDIAAYLDNAGFNNFLQEHMDTMYRDDEAPDSYYKLDDYNYSPFDDVYGNVMTEEEKMIAMGFGPEIQFGPTGQRLNLECFKQPPRSPRKTLAKKPRRAPSSEPLGLEFPHSEMMMQYPNDSTITCEEEFDKKTGLTARVVRLSSPGPRDRETTTPVCRSSPVNIPQPKLRRTYPKFGPGWLCSPDPKSQPPCPNTSMEVKEAGPPTPPAPKQEEKKEEPEKMEMCTYKPQMCIECNMNPRFGGAEFCRGCNMCVICLTPGRNIVYQQTCQGCLNDMRESFLESSSQEEAKAEMKEQDFRTPEGKSGTLSTPPLVPTSGSQKMSAKPKSVESSKSEAPSVSSVVVEGKRKRRRRRKRKPKSKVSPTGPNHQKEKEPSTTASSAKPKGGSTPHHLRRHALRLSKQKLKVDTPKPVPQKGSE